MRKIISLIAAIGLSVPVMAFADDHKHEKDADKKHSEEREEHGKPFRRLQRQINELRGQILDLQGQVGTSPALQGQIDALNAQLVALQAQVDGIQQGQTINLTIDPLQFPGIVAQDFVTLFPDAVNNTALVKVGFVYGDFIEAVIINGPGVEIQKVPGFDGLGRADDHSGLAQELPIMFEVADPLAVQALSQYVADYQASADPAAGPGFQNIEIVVRDIAGAGQVFWIARNFAPYGATPMSPGFDGRTRFVFGPSAPPDNTMDITRNPQFLGTANSFNPVTDRFAEVLANYSGMGYHPAVQIDSTDPTRLILTYDFVEGGYLLEWVRATTEIGTIGSGGITYIKDRIYLSEFDPITSMPFNTINYVGCFPVKYEQFTGFGQDIKLKERVTVDCDYVETGTGP